ncbi:unnamed protein product, partial [Mesorhabditis spiculigera]
MDKFGIIWLFAGIAYIQADNCERPWKKFGESCFLKTGKKLNFWEAELECAAKNSHLVTRIPKLADHEAFTNATENTGSIWMGVTKMPAEMWIHGKPKVGCAMLPTDWATEDGVLKAGLISCESEAFTVCELPLDVVPEAPKLECPEGWMAGPHSKMCYKVNGTMRNFMEAKDYCVGEGGTIVCPSNVTENAFLTQFISKEHLLAIWIGGSLDMKDNWSWLDDSPWGLEAWVEGTKPNLANGRCLQLFGNGPSVKAGWPRYWSNAHCENSKAAVACMKPATSVTEAKLRKLHDGGKK